MATEIEPVMECLGNPLKARVMIMIKEHGPLTAKQMLSYDSRIPQASLYRALKSMEQNAIIITVAETKVRAVVEKRYALNDELRGRIDEMVRNNRFFAVPVYATKDELEDMYRRILDIIRPAQTRKSEGQDLHTLAFIAGPPDKITKKEE